MNSTNILERLMMTGQSRPALRHTVLDAMDLGVPSHLIRRLTGMGRVALLRLVVVG
jgi:hypothetical protein